jgi:BTB/POZ domain
MLSCLMQGMCHCSALNDYAGLLRCRAMLSDLATNELPLAEDAATLRMLISSMYDPEWRVDWSNVEPILDFGSKYGMQDLRRKCERFLIDQEPTLSTLPQHMVLAHAHGMQGAAAACQEFIATHSRLLAR